MEFQAVYLYKLMFYHMLDEDEVSLVKAFSEYYLIRLNILEESVDKNLS